MSRKLEYIIPESLDGASVRDILRQRMGVSAGLLTVLKRTEQGITLDGKHVTVRDTVLKGQVLAIFCTDLASDYGEIVPACGALDIIFEDRDLLVLNKPRGLAVHPSRRHFCDTLANRVAFYMANERGDEPFVFRAVNRLDRGTSGLVCLAKSRLAASGLSCDMCEKAIKRGYIAVLEGENIPDCGTIDMPICRREGFGIMRCVAEDGDGLNAVTHYKILRRGNGFSLAEIALDTGRTHQIRVHFSYIGHPVAGDFMYGTERDDMDGFALHSYKMELSHPVTGEKLRLFAPVPKEFEAFLGESKPE